MYIICINASMFHSAMLFVQYLTALIRISGARRDHRYPTGRPRDDLKDFQKMFARPWSSISKLVILLSPSTCSGTHTTMPADFITTIDSDDEEEVPIQNGESSKARATPSSAKPKIDEDLNPEFAFDFDGSRNAEIDLWGGDELKTSGKVDNEVCRILRLTGSVS